MSFLQEDKTKILRNSSVILFVDSLADEVGCS